MRIALALLSLAGTAIAGIYGANHLGVNLPWDQPPASESASTSSDSKTAAKTEAAPDSKPEQPAAKEESAAKAEDEAKSAVDETVAALEAPSASQDAAPGQVEIDISRISPEGSSVFAGRAAPDSYVTVLEDGKPAGSVKTDANGEWSLATEHKFDSADPKITFEVSSTPPPAPEPEPPKAVAAAEPSTPPAADPSASSSATASSSSAAGDVMRKFENLVAEAREDAAREKAEEEEKKKKAEAEAEAEAQRKAEQEKADAETKAKSEVAAAQEASSPAASPEPTQAETPAQTTSEAPSAASQPESHASSSHQTAPDAAAASASAGANADTGTKRETETPARVAAAEPETRASEPKESATAAIPVPLMFVYNEATLTSEGERAAKLLLEYLTLKRYKNVELTGHADERGTVEYNYELSRERLDTVARLLKEGGYTGKLDLVPKGKTEPYQGVDRAKYRGEALHQLDRRVELRQTR